MLTVLIMLTGVTALVWSCGFIVYAGTITAMMEPKNPPKADAIIVLTGGTNRITKGFDLLAQGKASHLLISGVHKDVKLDQLLKLWGYEERLPECCITLGREAGNTIGNAQEAQNWVNEVAARSVFLVTSTYHMPRAQLEFHSALPTVKIIEYSVIPENFSPRNREFWRLSFIEYHKYIISFIRVTFFPWEKNPVPQALK